MTELSLQDQVVLIVGAGRPPAPALAMALAGQGAIIAANDLSPILLDPLANEVKLSHSEIPARIHTYVSDATRGMPLRAMLDEIMEDWGRIDILINNPRIQPTTALLSMDEWDWQRTIEMNLNGPFLVTQMVARLMQEQGGGVILNIVDTNRLALEAPGRAAYAASQQGLLALSQAAARELIAYNIRVNTLCPGDLLTKEPPQLVEVHPIPVSAPISHLDGSIAGLAVYLCSPQAAHLNGQIYQVGQMPIESAGQQE